MKKYLMILIGILPLSVGFLINYLIIDHNMFGSSITIISGIFMVLWFLIGFLIARTDYDTKTIYFYSLLPCFINYVLLMIQTIFLHRMWPSIIGILTQFYVLPVISFVRMFGLPFAYYTAATLIIVLIYVLGVRTSKRLQM